MAKAKVLAKANNQSTKKKENYRVAGFMLGDMINFVMMIYQEIKHDLFDVVKRIKSINKKYFVVFNKTRQKFEVHYARAKNTYELTIPYNTLDARAVDFVLETQMQNQKKLLEEIEKSNKKLQGELYGD